MRFLNFRTLFTLLLSITLCGFGVYLANYVFQDFPRLKDTDVPAWLINTKNFIDEIRTTSPRYASQVTVLCGALGLLAGLPLGQRLSMMMLQAGKRLEQMSANDKIAVGGGVFLGALVTLLVYQLLAQLKMAPILLVSIFGLVSFCIFFLCITATVSMKKELMMILARGGTVAEQEQTEANPTENCKILDTNVIIDGRIADVCRTGFIEGPFYVPGFVLDELQHIADSSDALKRGRGRRGLDILKEMKKELPLIVRSWDKYLDKAAEQDEVDTRLVKLAKALQGVIVTNDFNLNKVAALQGVQVLNVNELANALKPVVLPGEIMRVGIVKEGKESNQGVAYLEDGTMIVVEDGRRHIGDTLLVMVTSVLQTAQGKMIFAKVRSDEDGDEGDGNNYRSDGASYSGFASGSGGGGYSSRRTSKKVR